MDAILSKDVIPSAAGIVRDGEAICQELHGRYIAGSGTGHPSLPVAPVNEQSFDTLEIRDALRNIAERLDTFQPPESSGESASHLNQSTGSLLHAARQVFVSMCAGNENTSSHQPPTSHLASPSNLSNSHHLSTSVTPVLPSQEVLTNQAPLSSSYSAFNTTQPTVQSNSANPTSGTPPMIPLTTGLVHPIAVTVATESSTFHTTCSSTFCIFQFVYSTAIR